MHPDAVCETQLLVAQCKGDLAEVVQLLGGQRMTIIAANNIIEKAKKSMSAIRNQFNNELKQSQNYLISTQGPVRYLLSQPLPILINNPRQMEQEIMKEYLKISPDDIEEYSKKYNRNNIFDDEEKGSVSDQKSDMEEHQADK